MSDTVPLPLDDMPTPPRWKPVPPGRRQRVRPVRGQLRMVHDRAAQGRNRRTRDVGPLVIREGSKVRLNLVKGDRASIGAGRVTWPEEYDSAVRPIRREDCAAVPRPCPYVSCASHLYLDVEANGALRVNFPDVELDELRWSCASDLSDDDSAEVSEIAKRVNLSRERFREEYQGMMMRFAQAWEDVIGERAPMLDLLRVKRVPASVVAPVEYGEVGDIEWGT